jgi:Tol biopolymer transport system component
MAPRAAPPGPVARFESPFREGQEPSEYGLNAYDIAPDGSFLVYRGPATESFAAPQLWIRRWEDASATPIPGTVGAVSPSISPDGTEVAFRVAPNIIAMPLTGGPARALAEGSSPEWGGDGYIYFNDVGAGVFRVPVGGGAVDTVALRGDGPGLGMQEILPGGGAALLNSQGDDASDLYAIDFGSGELKALWPGQSPTYSPSGHVLGVTDGVLMAAPFDLESLELLGPPAPVMDSVVRATMSANGTLVYSKGRAFDAEGNTELVWVDRAGVVTPVESGWVFTRGGANFGWSLSPDGSRIALRRLVEDNLDIWVKDLPDGPLRRITFGENEQRVPFWTPDGSRVTYFSATEGNSGEVWWTRADGAGEPELLVAYAPGFAQGAWSPDGRWLVLRVAALQPDGEDLPGARDLVSFRPGVDSVPRPLLASPDYAEADPAFSRDGRWLAYVSNETGENQVFVRPFPDVETAKVQVSRNGGASPRWSHGGEHLFYVDPNGTMVEVAFEAGASFRVQERTSLYRAAPASAPVRAGNNVIDVAPGDERFLTGRMLTGNLVGVGQLTLVLVQNFAEELRRRMPR